MKRTPVYITVGSNGVTEISGYPNGFPVDGDALHSRVTLKKRAEALIVSDPALVAAARAWLGGPLHPSDPPLRPAQIAQLITKLFTGGAPRFIALAPSLQNVQVAS
jgi:hypothetical protein